MKLPQVFYWQSMRKMLDKLAVRRMGILIGALCVTIFAGVVLLAIRNYNGQALSPPASATPVASVPNIAMTQSHPSAQQTPLATKPSALTTLPAMTAPQKKIVKNPHQALQLKDFQQPIQGITIRGTSRGLIWWPLLADFRQHLGEDITAKVGTKVCAPAAGTVSEVGIDPIYGEVVVIQHADGWQTVYGQLGERTVKLKQIVQQGQLLGRIAESNGGEADLPAHLHYEIWHQDKPVQLVK
ncbi:MAG: M23 family metallopeptidase [Peptococcaceae bacterium]|nr:M23 family metallopeptidase [Peptococcaceae bacterium]